jgi:hypothetical protein
MRNVTKDRYHLVILTLILIAAACFRFYGLAWDSGYLFHPDERKIVLVASELSTPKSISEIFSPDSPLNPKFFAYGSFPIYLLKALAALAPATAYVVPWREDLVGLALLGRTLSSLFDLATIVFIFMLGRRLYNAWVGLGASACIATSVLHIQLAHFYAVDTLLTLLVVATIYFCVCYADKGKRRDAILIGASFGLALATKTSAIPLIIPIVFAAVKAREDGADKSICMLPDNALTGGSIGARVRVVLGNWIARVWHVWRILAAIFGMALAVFIITQPYLLLDPVRFFGQVGTELFVARGWLDYPYIRQYADTIPFVYQIIQSSIWGMGLPLGLFTWTGSALFASHWLRGHNWRDGFILSWSLAYFLAIGALYTKYPRYLLPLLPFLFLMACAFASTGVSRGRDYVIRCAFLISIVSAFAYSVGFDGIYSREHPWLQISRWMYANLPAHSTLAVEHWDDQLPVPMPLSNVRRDSREFQILTLPMYDADDESKVQTIIDTLVSSDYIVLASQRLSIPIARLPQRYPISSRYYSLLASGQLGFSLVAFAANPVSLDGLTIVDDRFDAIPGWSKTLSWNWGHADESFTVYDHPLPLVFKKTSLLSRDELRKELILP